MIRFLLILFASMPLSAAQGLAEACDRSDLSSARHAVEIRDFESALARYREASRACPNDQAVQLELANAYFMAQRLRDAQNLSTEILRRDPANAPALEIKGNTEFLLGDTRSSINTFIDLLDKHPANQEAPYMLGRIYYTAGLVDQAVGQFQRLLRLNPQSYRAYDGLGLCYEAKSDYAQAQRCFLAAIKLTEHDHPSYDTAYADLAELLLRTGENEKAFGAASKAADRNPSSARNFYLGGKALDLLSKTDLACNWLERAAALSPNYPEPQYLLARIYRRLGKNDQATLAERRFLQAKSKSQKSNQ